MSIGMETQSVHTLAEPPISLFFPLYQCSLPVDMVLPRV